MHSTYPFIDASVSDLFRTQIQTVSIPIWEMSSAKEKRLKKFVLAALIKKHINNTRKSIPTEKQKKQNARS